MKIVNYEIFMTFLSLFLPPPPRDTFLKDLEIIKLLKVAYHSERTILKRNSRVKFYFGLVLAKGKRPL